jgi:hypothetical protein
MATTRTGNGYVSNGAAPAGESMHIKVRRPIYAPNGNAVSCQLQPSAHVETLSPQHCASFLRASSHEVTKRLERGKRLLKCKRLGLRDGWTGRESRKPLGAMSCVSHENYRARMQVDLVRMRGRLRLVAHA